MSFSFLFQSHCNAIHKLLFFFSPASILPSDVTLLYCDFETVLGHDATCLFTNQSYGMSRGSGQVATNTGPQEDHTMGSPKGKGPVTCSLSCKAATDPVSMDQS